MSNLTRKEIIDAHKALDALDLAAWTTAEDWDDMELSGLWKSQILKALPPKPRPTMLGVDWEQDKHFLAVAEDTRDNQRYIMLFPDMSDRIRCIGKGSSRYTTSLLREYLAPTGERYTLKEGNE
ncbi:hypothetical protein R3O64_09755 [Corynebacterium hesseae]|uniref:hypothetical protein n=1 Tax=Corynebacterium hesseae TaxID=2913502 RepID=UPI0030D23C89